jgi:hypothetical protein
MADEDPDQLFFSHIEVPEGEIRITAIVARDGHWQE